ncbi:FitA-like ribbon-helix-helix domain-containing protein [Saccharopolyspora terrae]|uniref:FitA-like ribbon-helix-helix domain-containing protein n=1 Tax=Saccharopolyspora terrae TaxID=2530384 RepID=UPI0038B5C080
MAPPGQTLPRWRHDRSCSAVGVLATLTIRDVPDDDCEALRADARAKGRSFQECMPERAIELARKSALDEADGD